MSLSQDGYYRHYEYWNPPRPVTTRPQGSETSSDSGRIAAHAHLDGVHFGDLQIMNFEHAYGGALWSPAGIYMYCDDDGPWPSRQGLLIN